MKKLLIWSIAAALIIGAGVGTYWAYWLWPGPVNGTGGARSSVTVARGSIALTVPAEGRVALEPGALVTFGTAGIVAKVSVAKGDLVMVGQVLCQLDSADADLSVQQAEALLALAQARLADVEQGPTAAVLAAAEAALASARANLEETAAGPLAGDSASAQAALRSAQAAYDHLVAGPTADELTVLKANLERAEVARRTAQGNYDRFGWREGFEASPEAAALQMATIDYEQASAQYNLAAAPPTDSQLEQARARIAEAEAQVGRLAQGAGTRMASAAALVAKAEADLTALRNQPTALELEVAQAAVAQARIAVAQAERQRALGELKAPVAGMVTDVKVNVGQAVGVGQLAVTLEPQGGAHVEALVNELSAARVRPGQRAQLVPEGRPDLDLAGTVMSVSTLPVSILGTTNYEVTIAPERAKGELLAGMAVAVTIEVQRSGDALLLPRSSLVWRAGQWSVVRSGPSSRVQPVSVGILADGWVEVLDGLADGDRVLSAPSPGDWALAQASGRGQGGAQ